MSLVECVKEPHRVLLISTHPVCTNGYSKVVYNLLKQFDQNVEIIVYGFQKIDNKSRDLGCFDNRVIIHEVHNEPTDPFGFSKINEFVRLTKPDTILIYNDAFVVSTFLLAINESRILRHLQFQTIVYFDQVYDYTRKDYIDIFNKYVDHLCVFTPFWKDVVQSQGLTVPCSVIPHGVDAISRETVQDIRYNLGLDKNIFYVLNLNRNQPRKRWDITLMAIAHLYKNPHYIISPGSIKLLVGTTNEGCWDLKQVLNNELKGTNLTADDILVFVANPQELDDETIESLYHASDVGLNTCDGEGFGLCNVEHAYCGKPQIVPEIGSFLDLFDESYASMCTPVASYYVDNTRDSIGGKAQIIDYKQVADYIYRYYNDPDLCALHGNLSAEKMNGYTWSKCSESFRDLFS